MTCVFCFSLILRKLARKKQMIPVYQYLRNDDENFRYESRTVGVKAKFRFRMKSINYVYNCNDHKAY